MQIGKKKKKSTIDTKIGYLLKGKVFYKKDNLCNISCNCENVKTFYMCCHNRIIKQIIEHPLNCILHKH